MSVSILIPAFRPTFLRQAIASALTQGTDDFELIVSDDSGGSEVRAVVEQFRDPRIAYHATSGRVGGMENFKQLWGHARHDLVKYLFDDDLLMPSALVELMDVAGRNPQAAICFGQRYVIDELGRITTDPKQRGGEVVELDQATVTAGLVGNVQNPIGEFSNILINRAVGLQPDDFMRYMGFDLRVMGDVAFYLNASRKGPLISIGRPLAAFRRHASQNSSPSFNPNFAIGICEWELFVRGEWSAGRLAVDRTLAAIDKLMSGYANWSRTVPDIAQMAPGLGDLRQRVSAGERDVLDEDFRHHWAAFVAAVQRRARTPRTPKQSDAE